MTNANKCHKNFEMLKNDMNGTPVIDPVIMDLSYQPWTAYGLPLHER